jgi:pimeloyl-ACP methyl ester carboxylesterase
MWDGLIEDFEKLGKRSSHRFARPRSERKLQRSAFHGGYGRHAVHEVISVLGLKKPVVLGHSMGGYVALAYAELYENIGGLGLFFSTPYADSQCEKNDAR